MVNPHPHVVFVHLDLGIGGAESLVLNLAKATLHRNHNHGGEGRKQQPTESNEIEKIPCDGDGDGEPPSPFGSVSIYTTYCSPNHCYDEVRSPDGPLSSYVHVRGSWIPRKFYFGGTALCSAIRMLYLTYKAIKENPQANTFVIDVLPTGVPYLVEYCNANAGVLFYCHFPDKLLTMDTVNGEIGTDDGRTSDNRLRQSLKQLKQIYRWGLDSIEEWSMSYSDLIVVNSQFTKAEVKKVFPSLFLARNGSADSATNSDQTSEKQERSGRVKVLYPSIESSISKQRVTMNGKSSEVVEESKNNALTKELKTVLGPIVSLNRFERKKNVILLLRAYDLLLERVIDDGDTTVLSTDLPQLIIAGGYDPRNVENVEHLSELRTLADEILDRHNLPRSTVCSPSKSSADLDDYIVESSTKCNASIAFHPSISNAKRSQILSCASVWCYTPHREHFGIVPLEAMDSGVPVVAIRSGGPMETIVDGVTGYLVDHSATDDFKNKKGANQTVKGFADAIYKLLSNPSQSKEMGQRGRERVHEKFGMETFRKQWWELLTEAQQRGSERSRKDLTSYPSLGWSVVRAMGEMIWVVLFALVVTWTLKKISMH